MSTSTMRLMASLVGLAGLFLGGVLSFFFPNYHLRGLPPPPFLLEITPASLTLILGMILPLFVLQWVVLKRRGGRRDDFYIMGIVWSIGSIALLSSTTDILVWTLQWPGMILLLTAEYFLTHRPPQPEEE